MDVMINMDWVGVGECYRNVNSSTYLSTEIIENRAAQERPEAVGSEVSIVFNTLASMRRPLHRKLTIILFINDIARPEYQ
jgi:hypothetical protein